MHVEPNLWGLIPLILFLFVWFYPVFLIARSAKTTGILKGFWVVASVVLSWIAYGMYEITFWRR
jgi:hypothetical protein